MQIIIIFQSIGSFDSGAAANYATKSFGFCYDIQVRRLLHHCIGRATGNE